MAIFDDIIGNMSSLGDAFSGMMGGAVGAKGSGQNQDANTQEYRSLRLMNMLDNNVNRLSPNPRPGAYEVSKTQAPASVDPAEVQTRWLSRLNQYTSSVPAPAKGGK